MRNFWQDVRFGLRMLLKNPGFTFIAVLTLALGIGANTAIFSLLDQVLLRRLPVRNPEQLVILKSPGRHHGHTWSDGDDSEIFSYPVYKGLAKNTSVFDGVIAKYDFDASIASHGQTDMGSGELVTGNYFDVLGVRPALGRVLSPTDDDVQGAHPVLVLSYAYWTQHFGADPSVLNKTILVNNTEMTIVGVSQDGFSGIQVGETPNLFVPMTMKGQMTPIRNGLDDWNDSFLALLARLKPGVSKARAEAAIDVEYRPLLEQQIASLHLRSGGRDEQQFLNKKIYLYPGAQGRTVTQRDSGPAIEALFAMVGLVLLIACTNVANLLLAKGAGRQREFAIRSAMGATRLHMLRQLMVESCIYAVFGGLLGFVLGVWLMNLLTRLVVSESGVLGISASVDSRLLLFAAAATILSAILFGLLPAWRVVRSGVSQSLKDQGSTTSAGVGHVRFRKLLVAGQVAFTVLLLVGSSLFVETLWNLRKQNLGLKPDHLITFSIAPDLGGYDSPRTITLIDSLRERLAAVPGVLGVGSSEIPILTGTDMGTNITVEGRANREDDDTDVKNDAVSPNYFSTMGVPLLSGREFTIADTATSPKVAIINEAMAKAFLPGRNPIGVHFATNSGHSGPPDIEIVGVVANDKESNVRTPDRPAFYRPYAQVPEVRGMSFYVRTAQDPLLIGNALRDVVHQMDSNLPVYALKTLDRVVDEDLFGERAVAFLSAAFGGLAAALAALGIYGVLAYIVVQRTREIGIRLALGADTAHVRRLVFKELGVMVVLGAVAGLPLAYGLAKLSGSLLFGVQPGNGFVYLASLVVIGVVAAFACYLPSRRATRIDPIVALRYE